MSVSITNPTTRRDVLKSLAGAAAAVAVPAGLGALAQSAERPLSSWGNQIGLELYSVRDLLPKPENMLDILEKVAAIGYKEIEPAGNYGGMDPKTFRATLDRLGMTMPSTHTSAVDGPDLDKQLEGFQVMGIQYANINTPRPPGSPALDPKYRIGGLGVPPPGNVAVSQDYVKRIADDANKMGVRVKKFGMKSYIHNHQVEFVPLSDKPELTPYDVLAQNTDPSLVVLQMDIGWAAQGGADVVQWFKKYPGRYELWHVKDIDDLKFMPKSYSLKERVDTADHSSVPIGQGDLDYKQIFETAQVAGLKHFCVELDCGACWGDSMAASRVSYQYLKKILS
jgi:sugar phosphate isomerase/epimerase